jgi:hypothetical protein
MTLAQVVYHISNDQDFAEMWRTNPESALASRGLKLSKEEKAFLIKGMQSTRETQTDKVDLAHVGYWGNWFGR